VACREVRGQLADDRAGPVGVTARRGSHLGGTPGRAGGYCLDPTHTLAPLNFTVDEALAVMIALGTLGTSPFHDAATSALRKVVAVTDESSLRETADLAARSHTIIIEFLVADVDAEFARLQDDLDDVVLEPTTMPLGNRSTLFRDPDGNIVIIFSRPSL
jgi:catechol 2,3-dioxygenase-like lactoylglutathione lyase family enzyme